jgi:uncharacterized membrane protein
MFFFLIYYFYYLLFIIFIIIFIIFIFKSLLQKKIDSYQIKKNDYSKRTAIPFK